MAAQTIPLLLSKSTKGTHIFDNQDLGLKGVYLPRMLFPGGPEGYSVAVVITKNGADTQAAQAPDTEDQL